MTKKLIEENGTFKLYEKETKSNVKVNIDVKKLDDWENDLLDFIKDKHEMDIKKLRDKIQKFVMKYNWKSPVHKDEIDKVILLAISDLL